MQDCLVGQKPTDKCPLKRGTEKKIDVNRVVIDTAGGQGTPRTVRG